MKNRFTKKKAAANKFAVVLSGGGARGAYEAGVIYYIRTHMPREIAETPLFDFYCGTSVGAINSSFMASTANDPIFQGAQMRRLWRDLTDEDIYYADYRALTGFLVKSGFFMATNFFGLENLLEKRKRAAVSPFPFKSVLDTTPFVYFLKRNISWSAIHRNIERGVVKAVTVSTTHIMSGQLALFVEKAAEVEYRQGGPRPTFCTLSPKHILASAAIPLVFPIIRINRQFYGDGSLRQATPMSPAIHLGANRILVISTQSRKKERPFPESMIGPYSADPSIGDILGLLLDAVFMDKLEYDLEQMKRINFLISDFESLYGGKALQSVNVNRRKMAVLGKEIHEIKKILPFVILPSRDIGIMASEHFNRILARRHTLTPMQKFFSRILEGTPDGHNDLVSYLLFDHEYLESLLQMGFEDARKEHDQLVNFFTNQPLANPREQSGAAPGKPQA